MRISACVSPYGVSMVGTKRILCCNRYPVRRCFGIPSSCAWVGSKWIPLPAKEKSGLSSSSPYTVSLPVESGNGTPDASSSARPGPSRKSLRKTAGGTVELDARERESHGRENLLIRKYQLGWPAHSTSQG